MPSCGSENVSRFWGSSPPISRRNSTASSPSPGSPLSTSPPDVSPMLTLKRSSSTVSSASVSSTISSASSTQTTILTSKRPNRHHHHHHHQNQQHPTSPIQDRRRSASREIPSTKSRPFILTSIGHWYAGLVIGVFTAAYKIASCIIWAPALWVSAWVCMLWAILQLPLTALKWFLTALYTPASERVRPKRCVLISGGSTVQAVHLARNFYKAGARVVVCEVEGLFGLARFSTACSQFHTLPIPGPDSAAQYVKALRDIVQREKPSYYIPVSASTTAYYDALAKPHLEALGCECFVPGASEVTALDDPLELLRRCRSVGLPTPSHFVLRSSADVANLYERGVLRTGRHVMLAAGPAGMRDRAKVVLPPTVRDFRSENYEHEISDKRPWVVVRDPGGAHFLTCTTVKDSKVVANVTCRVDEHRGLIPEDRPDVSRWLDRFFARSPGHKMSGHLSFRLAESGLDNDLVSIGCRVGVSFPYVCHTGVHPRLVWRPCRHFSRQNSEHLANGDRGQNLNEAVANALKRPPTDVASHLLGTVLDKRETLFVYWDPLPYCAYYHLQLPFRRIAGVIRAQPAGQHAQPLALVQ
ncbi:uncharacterized protein LOC107224289 isoform X1 [Neodiprion lecontei]|uniref:Uncharacterized protein LOC107224289 isoform X1 n=2 Tax=Neodiprion lecontei TaxID=441921 RepID=A0A6J0BZR6_NEOLC|nr:uncharacterized protein LOC107224289 isoform X1 [Neodiprion lecontei]